MGVSCIQPIAYILKPLAAAFAIRTPYCARLPNGLELPENESPSTEQTGCPHWLVCRTFQAVFSHTFWPRKKKPHPPLPPRDFPNPIRLAQRWQTLIDEGAVSSRAQLARNLGCSRARVTQILSLLKLPPDEIEVLAAKGEFVSDKNFCERRLRELKKKQIVLP